MLQTTKKILKSEIAHSISEIVINVVLAHPEHAIPEKALDILPTTKYLVILKSLCSSVFPKLFIL